MKVTECQDEKSLYNESMLPHKYPTSQLIFLLVILGVGTALLLTQPKQGSIPNRTLLGATQSSISAIVLPHHNLVKQQRQDFLASVKDRILQPETIILVSPNHYESGSAAIQTTLQRWDTSVGSIEPNETVIRALIRSGVGDESGSFSNEHGIRLILGDLERNFPSAALVPLILKRSVDVVAVEKLTDTLEANCRSCLLVASVDFSHYQPAVLANLHDRLTERLLQNRDEADLLVKAEVDSPAALALMASWAEQHNTKHFQTVNHTNSGEITGNVDAETTTHLFGWYQAGEPTVPDSSVSFLVGGDMMFGRMIAHTFGQEKLVSALTNLGDRVFWGTDLGLINLEGPISDRPVPDVTEPNNLTFNFSPSTVGALKFLHINAVSQANNHSGNAGVSGLDLTRRLLTGASIQSIGGPAHGDEVRVSETRGQNLDLITIGLVAINGAVTPDLAPLIKQYQTDPNNRILIFPHWGNEYQPVHSQHQEAMAHAWIDAGADLVIGAHPHVVQDAELYQGVPIIYSLGNLLFDQTFSAETQQGMLIGGEFVADRLRLFALPTESRNLKPRLTTGSSKVKRIDALMQPFVSKRQDTKVGTIFEFSVPSSILN